MIPLVLPPLIGLTAPRQTQTLALCAVSQQPEEAGKAAGSTQRSKAGGDHKLVRTDHRAASLQPFLLSNPVSAPAAALAGALRHAFLVVPTACMCLLTVHLAQPLCACVAGALSLQHAFLVVPMASMCLLIVHLAQPVCACVARFVWCVVSLDTALGWLPRVCQCGSVSKSGRQSTRTLYLASSIKLLL